MDNSPILDFPCSWDWRRWEAWHYEGITLPACEDPERERFETWLQATTLRLDEREFEALMELKRTLKEQNKRALIQDHKDWLLSCKEALISILGGVGGRRGGEGYKGNVTERPYIKPPFKPKKDWRKATGYF